MTDIAPIVHLYFSPMQHESRLLRAASAAVSEGLTSKAIGIGYHSGDDSNSETVAQGVTFQRLPLWPVTMSKSRLGRLLSWPVWTIASARETARLKPSVVQAHSFASLPAAILASRLFSRAKLVYDAHELETERTGWSRGLRRVAKPVEKFLLRFVDVTLVVSGSIADWYSKAYGIPRPHLVRNIPELKARQAMSDRGIRETLALSQEEIIFVYLGRLGAGRGIPILVEAFQQVARDRHLVLLGNGPMEEALREVAAKYPNIHVLAPVPSSEVTDFIASADIGLCLGEDVSLSYRYSLPNKLFESRHAGLPIIVSNMPEMANFVRDYGGGWIIDANTRDVLSLISAVHKDEIEKIRVGKRPVPHWEEDRTRYIDIIAELLNLDMR